MILLSGLKLWDYRCIQEAELTGFGDVNIIIGPNNCGKSSVLRAINMLSSISMPGPYNLVGDDQRSLLEKWRKAWGETPGMTGIRAEVGPDDRHRDNGKPRIVFQFAPDALLGFIHAAFPGGLDAFVTQFYRTHDPQRYEFGIHRGQIETWKRDLRASEFSELSLRISGESQEYTADRVSLLWLRPVAEAIAGRVLMCEDARLQTYKGTAIADYIGQQDLADGQWTNTAATLRELVDPSISGYRPVSRRLVMADGFSAGLNLQGSGVKSLLCFLTELAGADRSRIVLIDEPELGLNPSAKHALLRHILGHFGDRQVFLATHDPTFANPVLWKMAAKDTKVSIFVYSRADLAFAKVNSNESESVAGSFAGYLTHTASPREAHIYVEGRTDAQSFRCMLDTYLWDSSVWREVEDRVEVFHLGGKFWSKLIATIPPEPYRSLVILDGDQRKVLSPPDGSAGLRSRLERAFPDRLLFLSGRDLIPDEATSVADKVAELQTALREGTKTVIYTLHRDRLELYLPADKQNAKQQDCLKAHRMTYADMPVELKMLFEAVARSLDVEPRAPNLHTLPGATEKQ